jgi:hypothetical protein
MERGGVHDSTDGCPIITTPSPHVTPPFLDLRATPTPRGRGEPALAAALRQLRPPVS